MKCMRVLLPLAGLFLPGLVLAAPRTFLDLSGLIVTILNNATAVLIVAGIVVYFYGVSTNILSFSDDGWEKVKSYFVWGIIVLFVMVSIWGILRLLQSTIFGGAGTPPSSGIQESSDPFDVPQFISE